MNKYLIKGMTLLAVCAGFASCSKDLTPMSQEEIDNLQALKVTKTYEQAFLNYIGGSIAEDQDWGFGSTSAASRMTRSQASPACPGITAPWDATDVATYLETATEPNSNNVNDNYDNSVYHEPVESVWVKTADAVPGTPDTYPLNYWLWDPVNACRNNPESDDYKWIADNVGWDKVGNVTNQAEWDAIIAKATTDNMLKFFYCQKGSEGTPEQGYWTEAKEGYWEYDETFVKNFKITGTYNGYINVAATEGLTDGTPNNNQRTVVVTGTWNITENQRIGSLGKIIIADGGTVNVASGVMLNMVNQAQLVVLRGGTLTGDGAVEVNNGNASGMENYNGGRVSVATFNNNFGKFYNYGDFLVTEYQGGAQESNFYNHHLTVIDHFGGTGSTANARIFNNCQFYVVNDARIRNYEGVNGSALIVGGQLMFSSSEDGTSTPTYVGLQQGALVKCATLYNNGTSWTGPTSGYAALEITDKIVYLNWQQDAPQTGGYFENNIYVKSATWDNVPDGNGYHQTDPSDATNYALSIADYKFWTTIANCRGNGGVKKVVDSNNVLIDGDSDFVLGTKGCSPGFKGDTPTPDTPTPSTDDPGTPNIRIIAEDLNANGSDNSDFDFNDVVIDVYFGDAGKAKAKIIAAGGTLDLRVDGQEVHELFGKANGNANYKGMMINTNGENSKYPGVKARSIDNRIQPVITLTKEVNSAEQARDNIEIEVYKNNAWIPLTAKKGEPASKIGVDPTYSYCDEREEISSKHTGFKDWVKGNGTLVWWE